MDYIYSLTNNVQCSLVMTIAAIFIKKMRRTLYPSQNVCNLNLKFMYIDILNLLCHDADLQQIVVTKIESFLGRLAHMTLVDMIKHRKHEDLADMWYTSSVDSTRRAQLDEINMIFFLCVIFLISYEILYVQQTNCILL